MKNTRKGPKRGVSVFSYAEVMYKTMDFEDALIEMQDLGATGIEILGNGHIPNYPMPTDEWVDHWYRMLEKYNIEPAEYGHWVDSRMYRGRLLTTEESLALLKRDILIANKLGFHVMRTKLGCIDDTLTPVANWQEFIKQALEYAEKYDVCMCPEIHQPTALKSKMVNDYVEFIEKEKTTHFGLNIDFGTFQNYWDPDAFKYPGIPEDGPCSYPEDIIPLLPYVHACHAKFNYVDENFKEKYIPYEEILKILVDHNWDGYLISEYENMNMKDPIFISEQLRRQHVMMKRILGY